MRLGPLAIATLSAALLGACVPAPLRVGTAADYAPLAYEEAGVLRGIEIDFAERVARELGRPLALERIRFEEMNRPESRVGFRTATTAEGFVRASLPRARAVGFDTIEAAVAALRSGEIDCFVHDAPAIWRIVGGFASDERQLTGLYRPLTDERLAWAVRPDDAELAGRLDALLARWERDRVVEEILDVWIPVRKIDVPAPERP
jgi:ABC-type amino acid transport substrate-binding protein